MTGTALEAFLAYTRRFGDADPRYELKRVHTLGVLGYINALCLLEQVPAPLAQAARLCAVFHDVGRFEQLRRYGTFFDSQSEDHAALSVKVCLQEGFLDGHPLRDQILEAIAQHNRLCPALPDPLSDTLCRLVRDADKLDILRVFATDDVQDVTSFTLEQACQSLASPAVVRSLLSGRPADKRDRQSPIDIWLTYLGFVNDFHFASSYRLCEAAGYWKRRFAKNCFADPAVLACVRHAEEILYENRKRTESHPGPDRRPALPGL